MPDDLINVFNSYGNQLHIPRRNITIDCQNGSVPSLNARKIIIGLPFGRGKREINVIKKYGSHNAEAELNNRARILSADSAQADVAAISWPEMSRQRRF